MEYLTQSAGIILCSCSLQVNTIWMLLMQLPLFYGNKDSSKYLALVNTEKNCVSVLILRAQRTTGG